MIGSLLVNRLTYCLHFWVLQVSIFTTKYLQKIITYSSLRFDSFHATGLFLYHPLKTPKKQMFSGGIERKQWYEME